MQYKIEKDIELSTSKINETIPLITVTLPIFGIDIIRKFVVLVLGVPVSFHTSSSEFFLTGSQMYKHQTRPNVAHIPKYTYLLLHLAFKMVGECRFTTESSTSMQVKLSTGRFGILGRYIEECSPKSTPLTS